MVLVCENFLNMITVFWIFYFLKNVNGKTSDNWLMKYLMSMVDGLRFRISIQLIL